MRKPLLFLLSVSLIAFAIDLAHMIFHLIDEPALWKIEGVPVKFAIKFIFFLIPLIFLLKKSVWMRWILLFLTMQLSGPSISEARVFGPSECAHARELLEDSGTARDATEDFLGRVHRKPPYGTFPSDMDQVAWWGIFKPFEFWQSPEFKAVWINPEGQEVVRQTFRGNKCRLATTSIKAKDQPRGELAPGMWKVIVTCKDYLIDRQSFAVIPARSTPTGPDTGNANQESAMIWTSDLLDQK